MINKQRVNRISAVVVCILLAVWIGDVVYEAIVEKSANPFKYREMIPDDYSKLFNKDSLRKFSIKGTMSFQLRNSISYLSYDKKYNLEITKIDVDPNFNLKEFLAETYREAKGYFPMTTVPWDEGECITTYITRSKDKVSKIYLSLIGDSVKTIIKNDSVAYYYLQLKNLSVQYKPKGLYEISAETKKSLFFFPDNPPLSLLFLRKKDKIYFLFLTVKDDNVKLTPELLYNLTMQK